jgi:hypothetical protein
MFPVRNSLPPKVAGGLQDIAFFPETGQQA